MKSAPPDARDTQTARDLVCIGKIVGCFGIKGYVKVQAYTHSPERYRKLKAVSIGNDAAGTAVYGIEHAVYRNPHMHVKLSSVDDRTRAETLAGQYIFIARQDVARPPKGSWFVDDIVGCRVFTEEDVDVGVVREVLKLGGSDLWVVENGTASNIVPAVPEFIREVDVKHKRIVIHAIEGLLDQS